MQIESYYPFLLIIGPFALAYFAEALIIYLFRLKTFWASTGIALVVNLLSLAVLYGCGLLLGKLGYVINGLQVPLQVFVFFWWLSIITDGVLLQLFIRKDLRERVFLCSLVMNSFSWIFLYLFIINN